MRTLRASDVLAFGIGTIVGVGWIVAVGDWLLQAGPGGAALAFSTGAIFVALVSRCYGDMTQRFPDRGGEIAVAGRVFGPGTAFATGCGLVVLYLAAITFEAAALRWLCTELALAAGMSSSAATVGVVCAEIGTIAIISIVNARGTVASSWAQDALTIVKVVGILTLVVLGVCFGRTEHMVPLLDQGPKDSALLATISVAVSTPFWFAGFNVIAQATAERSPDTTTRQIARAMTTSVLIAGVLYAGIILAVGGLVPRTVLQSLPLPAADAFAIAAGSKSLKAVVIGIGMLGIIAAWNGMVFALVRVIIALTTADFLQRQHSDVTAAAAARYAIAATIIAASIGAFVGRPAMSPAISASAVCISLVFAMVCAAALTMRWRDNAHDERGSLPAAIGGLALSIGMVVAALAIPPMTSRSVPTEWLILAPAALCSWIVWRRTAARRHSSMSAAPTP